MRLLERFSRLFLLGGFAFLGFYVYGLVMSVFSPGEMVGFTILAVVFAVAGVIHFIRFRRVMQGPEKDRITHELQLLKEKRGF